MSSPDDAPEKASKALSDAWKKLQEEFAIAMVEAASTPTRSWSWDRDEMMEMFTIWDRSGQFWFSEFPPDTPTRSQGLTLVGRLALECVG